MREKALGLVIGISIGVVIGVALAVVAFFCMKWLLQLRNSRAARIPIFGHDGDDSRTTISADSSVVTDDHSPKSTLRMSFCPRGLKKANAVPASGIPEYSYKDIEKATSSFTTLIGGGAFGPVYRARMSTGETVAVKVLAKDSKQGEKEFQTEVRLLGRLHHRNLVNLVGYCADKHMLVYEYMSRGSLASHLYSEKMEPLNWELRVQIALDVARALEYLHDGAVPSVVHCDIKSSNILLDESMRARVADFGLSREARGSSTRASDIQGTFGYVDPDYLTTRSFSEKSDVYSYGVLLFELVAGRNPLQGLMEYVQLAAMSVKEGEFGWEEIGDPRLQGKFNVEELDRVAALAHECVSCNAKRRPSMRAVLRVLSRIVDNVVVLHEHNGEVNHC